MYWRVPACSLKLLVIYGFLISCDYIPHQLMSDYITFIQHDHVNSFHFIQNTHGLNKSTRLFGGKINLCNIAGNIKLCRSSHACKEHLKLTLGGILSLIQNYKSMVQCSTAHKSQWRDFNDPAFQIRV